MDRLLVFLLFIILFCFSGNAHSANCDPNSVREPYETSSAAEQAASTCLPILGEKILAEYRKRAHENPQNAYLQQFLTAKVDDVVSSRNCGNEVISKRFIVTKSSKRPYGDVIGGFEVLRNTTSQFCWNLGQVFQSVMYFPYKKTCEYPYTDIEGECATYCPPDAPELKNGECVSAEKEQCKFNPVVMGSGEKIQTETDIVFGSPLFPIEIKRIYRSKRSDQAKTWQRSAVANNISPEKAASEGWIKYIQPTDYHGKQQPNFLMKKRPAPDGIPAYGDQSWAYSNFHYITIEGNETRIIVNYGDKEERFSLNAENKFVSDKHYGNTLEKDIRSQKGDDKYWQFNHYDGSTMYFTKEGIVTSVINDHGLTHYYKWEKSLFSNYRDNTLIISDDFGNAVTIKLDYFNTIESIKTSSGINLTYQYNKYRNLVSLSKSFVSDSGEETKVTKTYHYEDPRFPYSLTGLTDENDIRYATWEYDEYGRVVKSSHINGIDEGTIAYDKNITTTTNSLGKRTKYHYEKIAGTKRLTKVEGVQTAQCEASNRAYTYYDSGRVKTKTDWEGNVTYFEYNERGNITKQVNGYGTEKAYEVETKWDTELSKPLLITYPEKIESFKYNDDGLLISKLIQSRK